MKTWQNFEFFRQILWAQILGNRVPFSVQFSVTSHCNSRCNYCYAKYYQRQIKELTTIQIKKIISKLVQNGTKRLSLVGGEPFVRNDIGEIINYAKSKNLEVALTTNGYLLEKNLFSAKKLDLLVFSLDGQEKNHDLGREKGSWQKTMKALKLAYNNKIPLQISAVLTNKNLKDLDWLAEIGKKYNCLVSFTPMINQQEGDKKIPIYKLIPSNQQYRRVFKKIIAMKKQGAPFLYHPLVYQATVDWPDYKIDKIKDKKPDFDYIKCQAGRYTCLIDSNADLYPCPQLVDEFKAGNILKDGFAKSWEKAGKHCCQACFSPCSNNLSLIFCLNWQVLIDLWQNYQKK